MRQLGARLPEPPPVKTDVDTSPEIQPHERHPVLAEQPYPVEVHRIELSATEAVPVEPLPPSPEPMIVPEAYPEPITEVDAQTQAPPKAVSEPIVEMEAPVEASVETAAMMQPQPIPPSEEPAPAQAAPEASAPVPEPIVSGSSAPEPKPELLPGTQSLAPAGVEPRPGSPASGESHAEPVVTQSTSVAAAERIAVPQAIPESGAQPAIFPKAPRELVDQPAPLRITEAPRNPTEQILRRPPRPCPSARRRPGPNGLTPHGLSGRLHRMWRGTIQNLTCQKSPTSAAAGRSFTIFAVLSKAAAAGPR